MSCFKTSLFTPIFLSLFLFPLTLASFYATSTDYTLESIEIDRSNSVALLCSDAVPIAFGETKATETNIGYLNLNDFYIKENTNFFFNETGGERIYKFEVLTDGKAVSIQLEADVIDLDLFLLNECKLENVIAAFADTPKLKNISKTLDKGTYYIIVDGYQGAAGNFSLTLTSTSVEPLSISCGDVIEGTTKNAALINQIYVYDICNEPPLSKSHKAREQLFKLTVNEPMIYRITLEDTSGLQLFYRKVDNNNTEGCWKQGQPISKIGKTEISFIAEPGDYLISVDGLERYLDNSVTEGPYKLEVTCFDTQTQKPLEIECGLTISGSTLGKDSYFQDDCDGANQNYTAGDDTYSFYLSEPQTIVLQLENTSHNDLDMFLMGEINYLGVPSYGCIAESTNPFNEDEGILINLDAGDYEIVIDGKDQQEGAYNLSLNCFDLPSVCNLPGQYIDKGLTVSGILDSIISSDNLIFQPHIVDRFGNQPLYGEVYIHYFDGEDDFFEVTGIAADESDIAIAVFNCNNGISRANSCIGITDENIDFISITPPTIGYYYILVLSTTPNLDYTLNISPEGTCTEAHKIDLSAVISETGSNFIDTLFQSNTGFGNNLDASNYVHCIDSERPYDGEDFYIEIDMKKMPSNTKSITINVEAAEPMGLFLFDYLCGENCIAYAETDENTKSISLSTIDIIGEDDQGIYYLIVDRAFKDSAAAFSLDIFINRVFDDCFYPEDNPEHQFSFALPKVSLDVLKGKDIYIDHENFFSEGNFGSRVSIEQGADGKLLTATLVAHPDKKDCGYLENDPIVFKAYDKGTFKNGLLLIPALFKPFSSQLELSEFKGGAQYVVKKLTIGSNLVPPNFDVKPNAIQTSASAKSGTTSPKLTIRAAEELIIEKDFDWATIVSNTTETGDTEWALELEENKLDISRTGTLFLQLKEANLKDSIVITQKARQLPTSQGCGISSEDYIVQTINATCENEADGQAFVISQNPNLSFTWLSDAGPVGFNIISGLDVGNLPLLITNENDCTIQTSVSIGVDEDIIPPTTRAKNVILNLTEDGTVSLSPEQIDNGSTDNCGIEDFTLSKTQFNCNDLGYNVVVLRAFDASGNATSGAAAIVEILDSDGFCVEEFTGNNTSAKVNLSKTTSNFDFKVFPNPSDGLFTIAGIKNNDANLVNLKVVNLVGKVIYTAQFLANTNAYQLDLTTEIAGVYFVQIESEEQLVTQKIILK